MGWMPQQKPAHNDVDRATGQRILKEVDRAARRPDPQPRRDPKGK